VSERTARPRALAAPVTSVVSGSAWVLLLVLVVAAAASVPLAWAELRVAAVFAALLLPVCALFVIGSNRLAATLDLSRTRVVVGERATGRLALTNAAARRMLPLQVELPVGTGVAVYDVPSLRRGAEHEELFAIPTHRRAVLDLGPVRAVRTDPFGLLRRDRELTRPDLLHVHPRTVLIEGSASGFIRDLEGETIRKISDNDVAFHTLREYVPGDDRRFVHWKSTARTGTLMVRQFEETRRSHLMVVLSTRLDDYATDEEFELAVSVAGSLGAQALRDGHTLSILTSTTHLRSDHATAVLDQLAGVDYDPTAPRLPDAVRRLGRQVTGASVAMLLCGSTVEASDLRRARRLLSPDVRAVAVGAELAADSSLRVMGDLDLATLGALDDLGGIMRRLAR
jgi:uncharacterized protein (DUF58 family)